MDDFSFSVYFVPESLYIAELVTTVLKNKSVSSAATVTNNKVRCSVVCLSVSIRLTGKFAFTLFLFYPNQCRFSGGPPLGGLLAKPVDFSCLL